MKDIAAEPLAEVMSGNLVSFTADLREGAARPDFGSFITSVLDEEGETPLSILAVVLDVVTCPPDSIHKPSALGLSRRELKKEQPHIFALLKTEIKAAILGYIDDDRVYNHLPPRSPLVHDFVYQAEKKAVIALTDDFEYLRLLFNFSGDLPKDEILAAAVRQAALHRPPVEREAYLVEAGQALCQLLRSDYERMVSVVRKIKPSPVYMSLEA
ncbi:MAG: hypothetical protein K2Y32_03450 [Candidatus Obscuribacterales bacterium]|nr:hypothetical protein [Candidatus Obscuribacterales bacterium]